MARKVCSAGTVGSVSYVIVNTDKEIISMICDDDNEIVTTHLDMDFAEKWTDRKLPSGRAPQNVRLYTTVACNLSSSTGLGMLCCFMNSRIAAIVSFVGFAPKYVPRGACSFKSISFILPSNQTLQLAVSPFLGKGKNRGR